MDFETSVSGIVDTLDLEHSYDKEIIKYRFLNEINFYEKKRDHTKKFYNAFRFCVTTGSILLPAILSMGQMDPAKLPKNFDQITYWTTWMISLLVTASNGFLQLFSLDKNFFAYSMVVEQLKTEGWQFFGLSGKYEDYKTHQEAYKTFSKSIETIKRKQVAQEFSNGKDDGKKKKFDFQGEMKKFSDDQVSKTKEIESKLKDEMKTKLKTKMKNELEKEKESLKQKLEEEKESMKQKLNEEKETMKQKLEEEKDKIKNSTIEELEQKIKDSTQLPQEGSPPK